MVTTDDVVENHGVSYGEQQVVAATGTVSSVPADTAATGVLTASVPTTGELDLEERSSFRRISGSSDIYATDQDDGYDVEYRKLRLERVILVGVWTEGTTAEIEATMRELAALAQTAGSEVVDMLYQKRDRPDPGTYIGSGKVQELKDIVQATNIDTVICDGELSPGQMIALEKALDVKVIDRTMLILDIFAQHAKSKEGKAQVSLAQMEYLITRVRGWGGALSRQAGGRAGGSNGGVGLRGPGETKIEADRRRLRSDMAKLRKEIAGMQTARRSSVPAGGRRPFRRSPLPATRMPENPPSLTPSPVPACW